MLAPIFDSHAHYDDEAFDSDRDALLCSMTSNGIDKIINVGASLASTQQSIDFTKTYPFVYAAVGVHPSESAELSDTGMQQLRTLAHDEKAVAIGEIGLDYYWDEPAHNIQKHWFIEQLHLAKEVNLPVIIHSREAAKDTIDILKEHAPDTSGVIHCYSYSRELAHDYLNMGYYFGIGGVITFNNAKKLKEAVAYIPLDRILLETDCPYLAPVPNRGKRNSSLNLPSIAKEIAAIKQVDVNTVITTTYNNTMNLFTKVR